MKIRQIKNILKKHLKKDDINALNCEKIPTAPDWLKNLKSQSYETHKKAFRPPIWAIASACVAVIFLFLLTSPGRAISRFIFNVDIQWNKTESRLEVNHRGDRTDNAYLNLPDNSNISEKFSSIEKAISMHPNTPILINDSFPLEVISISSSDSSLSVVASVYLIGGNRVNIVQEIYSSDFGYGGNISLTENAVPVNVSFNHNSINASGGYENGYGKVIACDKNCLYTFTCDNLSIEAFSEFIEGCYIRQK